MEQDIWEQAGEDGMQEAQSGTDAVWEEDGGGSVTVPFPTWEEEGPDAAGQEQADDPENAKADERWMDALCAGLAGEDGEAGQGQGVRQHGPRGEAEGEAAAHSGVWESGQMPEAGVRKAQAGGLPPAAQGEQAMAQDGAAPGQSVPAETPQTVFVPGAFGQGAPVQGGYPGIAGAFAPGSFPAQAAQPGLEGMPGFPGAYAGGPLAGEAMEMAGAFGLPEALTPDADLAQGDFSAQGALQALARPSFDEAARVTAELTARAEQAQAVVAQIAAQAEAEHATRTQQMRELLAYAPGLSRLPSAVMDGIDRGMTPLAAYVACENAALRAQLQAARQAQRNRAAAPGSAAGFGTQEPHDPFLEGFLAGG